MHLCTACRHFNAGWSAGAAPESQCLAPGNMQPDYVNGGMTHIALAAQTCRTNRTLCSPQAIWYQPQMMIATPPLDYAVETQEAK